MKQRFIHLRRDERGISIVFTAIGLMAFLAATTLSIDVGMFMAARTQAQNAADAGALAGATALAFNSYTDRSATGPAVTGAISASTSNQIVGTAPSVKASDVTFPIGPTGNNDEVQVTVYRTAARANAVPTMMGVLFGVKTVDIGATATAWAAPANAETCVKPFTIPDRWIEKQTGPWDPTDSFDLYDNKGNSLPNPDVYIGPQDKANYTGYDAVRDKGMEIVLKANNSTKVTASFYNPWDLPGSVGASDYSNNISGCNPAVVPIGGNMPPENGNMVGPTSQGTDDLVAKDPNAYWDTATNSVKGSAYGSKSPRIVIIPLYDPVAFANGQQSGKGITLTVVNFLGFFIEGMSGNQVTGRVTPVGGIVAGNVPAGPPAAFPKAIQLVK